MLDEENTSLRDRTNRDWFLAGAGVLFGGILLGLLVPKLRKRKNWSDWG
jgi:SH3 domain protein